MSPGTTDVPLVAFRVEAGADDEDAVVAALWDQGTTGVEVQPGARGTVVLLAYFPERPGLAADLRSGLPAHGATGVAPASIPDVDWVARFREGFRSFRAGRFHIVPAWEPAGGSGAVDGITVRILPGRAFGTGTHESTRLCLGALESRATRGPLGRVLDIGGGTGILAVAAALLGASRVAAVDIDPDAVESARLHARLNRVEPRLVQGDGGRPFARHGFDLVVANLTAPLLLERRHEIAGLCAPGASAILAGFLRDDAPEIAAAYAALGASDVRSDGEWAALVMGPVA
jgi:ribosomal protein L11 methyltransferase